MNQEVPQLCPSKSLCGGAWTIGASVDYDAEQMLEDLYINWQNERQDHVARLECVGAGAAPDAALGCSCG